MKRIGHLLVSIAGAFAWAGCTTPCPTEPHLDTPERTIATFREAFACDAADDVEYRCFSDDVKRAFGGLPAYKIGRKHLRIENPELSILLRVVDLEARTKVTTDPDGVHALARIDGGDKVLEIELDYEPEYALYLANGKIVRGFARCEVARTAAGEMTVRLLDENLQHDLATDATFRQRVDIRPRWVIASLPRLLDAIQASRSGRDPRTVQE